MPAVLLVGSYEKGGKEMVTDDNRGLEIILRSGGGSM